MARISEHRDPARLTEPVRDMMRVLFAQGRIALDPDADEYRGAAVLNRDHLVVLAPDVLCDERLGVVQFVRLVGELREAGYHEFGLYFPNDPAQMDAFEHIATDVVPTHLNDDDFVREHLDTWMA